MDSIARVHSAINREPAAPAPRGELVLEPDFMEQYLVWERGEAAVGGMPGLERLIALCRSLRLDLVCLPCGGSGSLAGSLAADIRRLADEGLFVFGVMSGPFQALMELWGAKRLLPEISRAPEDVAQGLSRVAHQVNQHIALAHRAGSHGVIIAEDIAYNCGPYMSPEFIHRYLLPLWRQHVATAKEFDLPVFFHSDGDCSLLLPHVVKAGFDGLQGIEPAAGMDIAEVKREYGGALCLMGNIDPALLAAQSGLADPQHRRGLLRQAVRELLASMGHGGGFIFGTCSGLHGGMSPEMVHVMYETAAGRPETIFTNNSQCN